jgi:thioredoxin 1
MSIAHLVLECTSAGTSRGNEGGKVSEATVTVTDNTFDEEVQGSSTPVLVDFWAEWCGPCKMVAPILDEIASEKSGAIRIAKLNVDDNVRTAQRFEVMSIPTMILFKDGEAVLRIVGAKSKSALLADLEVHL